MTKREAEFKNEGGGEVRVSVSTPTKCQYRLFERSNGSVIHPRYDSSLLEDYFLECAFPHATSRLRFILGYVGLVGLVWGIYAIAAGVASGLAYLLGGIVTFLLCAVIMGLTFVRAFARVYRFVSVIWAVLIILITLAMFGVSPTGLSYIALIGIVLQIILINYIVVPAPFYICIILNVLLSVAFEVLLGVRYNFAHLWAARILVQIAIHAIGMHLHLVSQIRRRTTFLKLCQSARSKKEIRIEQKANRDLIESLMPGKVAKEVMEGAGGMKRRRSSDDRSNNSDGSRRSEDEEEEEDYDSDKEDLEQASGDREQDPAKTSVVTFRKFHVSQMENVSILYADIVGFTNMSSNKTAPHLVFLLNDLFGRFDRLCELNGCEKIATLGDCYYCVSGCPDAVENHAERCVEMGRSMCVAIQQFDEDHHEQVNMRVGVHTGMVICGIVGTRRFKFDVWSNDVNLANEMESSGQAGKVHISESTLEFVDKLYRVEEGEPVPDIRKIKVLIEYFDDKQKCYAIKHTQDEAEIKTYFIVDRYDGKPPLELPRVDKETLQSDKQNAALAGGENTEKEADAGTEAGDEGKALCDAAGTGAAVEADASVLGNGAAEVRRESSDSALVEDMRAEKQSKVFYFPPISPLSLTFGNQALEAKFRMLGLTPPKRAAPIVTMASPRVTPLIDALVFAAAVLLTSAACFAEFALQPAQIPVLLVAVLLTALLLLPLVLDVRGLRSAGFLRFYASFFSWFPRNLCGAFILALPSVTVLATLMLCSLRAQIVYTLGFCMLLLFTLIVYALFTMYNFWTKLVMSLITGIVGIVLVVLAPGAYCGPGGVCGPSSNATTTQVAGCNATTTLPAFRETWDRFGVEFVMAMLLTLLLVNFVNREFEISYRLSFNCDQMAIRERVEIKKAKRQAEWLLENIIPDYIIEDLKTTHKYSNNMKDVGVIFATLSNFSQFYDEQFQGGREMLRVLNEIFADFEHLLPQFGDVEKIKTIGACFMAASGLSTAKRKKNDELGRPDAHLYALMDFCLELLETIEEFNKQIFNFDFELKIGFNIGDVTAGVIGSTKLLYDIWGDTVNVASRMYSTGVKGRIQVTEQVANRLGDAYEFEYRGEVWVKGKGDMRCHFLKSKK